jgi:hypothetical protein
MDSLVPAQVIPQVTPAELRKSGWSRDGVNAVVCTHLHVAYPDWSFSDSDPEAAVDTRWCLYQPRE